MLLGVDVGNTNITFGLIDGEEILLSFRITTTQYLTGDEMGLRILSILIARGYSREDVDEIIVTSVVPSIMDALIMGLSVYLGVSPLVLKNTMNLGIKIKTDYPNELGMDRIVDLVAAKEIYGSPVIVVDFGTATTYDLLNEEGDYIAGVTAPGVRTSLVGLVQKAAKLTNIEIEVPSSILAKNTIDSMKAGVTYGQIGQAEYIISRLKEESKVAAKVVITGGLGSILAKHIRGISAYDKELTLKGLAIISRNLENK